MRVKARSTCSGDFPTKLIVLFVLCRRAGVVLFATLISLIVDGRKTRLAGSVLVDVPCAYQSCMRQYSFFEIGYRKKGARYNRPTRCQQQQSRTSCTHTMEESPWFHGLLFWDQPKIFFGFRLKQHNTSSSRLHSSTRAHVPIVICCDNLVFESPTPCTSHRSVDERRQLVFYWRGYSGRYGRLLLHTYGTFSPVRRYLQQCA